MKNTMNCIKLAALVLAGLLAAATQARPAVAFVEAHPDDLAGHLGTALRLAETHDVHVIDFTHGELGCGVEKFKSGWTRRTRIAEESNVCSRAGFVLHWCDEIDGSAYAGEKACRQLADMLKKIGPRAVFCHWPIDTHTDHIMSAAATLKAVRLAGLEPELYFHEQDSQSRSFAPCFRVDITAYVKRKADLVSLYACQRGEAIAARKAESNRVYGRNASLGNVELFGVFSGKVHPAKSIFADLPGVSY